jgi:hypothetical protein
MRNNGHLIGVRIGAKIVSQRPKLAAHNASKTGDHREGHKLANSTSDAGKNIGNEETSILFWLILKRSRHPIEPAQKGNADCKQKSEEIV